MNLVKCYDIIRRPIVTEKTTILSQFNKVTFEVLRVATKPQIKSAVESIFGVKVSKVHVINVKGKVKRFKGTLGKCSDIKKAIITLSEGNMIDVTGVVK
jgi:large subunit ribosomal protein L23